MIMHKKSAVLLLFFVIALSFFWLWKKNVSTTKPKDMLSVSFSYSPKKISLDTDTLFSFTLTDQQKAPLNEARIDIEANMNHAGMVPLFARADFLGDGVYQAKIKLTMKGSWILFLTITTPKGEKIKKDITFSTE